MMTETRARQIRAELHERVALLANERGHLSLRQIVESVDAIRSTAQASGFGAVTCLAQQLESALARDVATPTLLCYLDAIDDAVRLEPMRAPAQTALLASVALRIAA